LALFGRALLLDQSATALFSFWQSLAHNGSFHSRESSIYTSIDTFIDDSDTAAGNLYYILPFTPPPRLMHGNYGCVIYIIGTERAQMQ
jgi:hypothetical protein